MSGWQKASSSGPVGNCVEFAKVTWAGETYILVRDSKAKGHSPTLRFTVAEIEAMFDGVRRGEFDHLVGEPNLRFAQRQATREKLLAEILEIQQRAEMLNAKILAAGLRAVDVVAGY